jgi:hypothetical protein
MNERQHHLNESSSARLGGSQQLEILPSPNSKQTQSLGPDFSDGGIALAPIFLISAIIFIRCRDFNVRLASILLLTPQVSTASLPCDCEPCEIKVVFNHT